MNFDQKFDTTLGLLYESSIAPERLRDALQGMVGVLQADACLLAGWNRNTGAPNLSVTVGLNEQEIAPKYYGYYAEIDPRRALSSKMLPGAILASHEHFDDRFINRSEFYQDFLIPQVGMTYLLGASDIIHDTEHSILIGFLRQTGRGPFESTSSVELARLLPHVQRTLRISQQITHTECAREASEAALASSNLAVFALTALGTIIWTNAQGAAMLRRRHGLRSRRGELHGSTPGESDALKSALKATIRTGRPHNLRIGEPGASCSVSLVALKARNPMLLPSARAEVLAVVMSDKQQRVASVAQLLELFRLSPAEARCVRALAHGETLESYASQEGIKRSTAKSHVLSAMMKTDTNSQRDLVRLVVSLPALRDK